MTGSGRRVIDEAPLNWAGLMGSCMSCALIQPRLFTGLVSLAFEEKSSAVAAIWIHSRCNTTVKAMKPSIAVFSQGYSLRRMVT